MPLAALLGVGDASLTGLPGPRLDPAHVAIVGARSWEPEEEALLESLGVSIFYMPEVRRARPARRAGRRHRPSPARAPPASACRWTWTRWTAPACPPPPAWCPTDSTPRRSSTALHGLRSCADLVAFEIVEYVPERDRDGSGAQLGVELAAAALGPTSLELRQREETLRRPQLRAPAGGLQPRRGRLAVGRGRPPLPGHDERLLGGQLRPQPPAPGAAPSPSRPSAWPSPPGPTPTTACPYCWSACPRLLGYDRALPVNTGLEAVETATQGRPQVGPHASSGVPDGQAEIIVCDNNFHGRSTTIVSFSSEAQYRAGLRPLRAGLPQHPLRRRRRPRSGHHAPTPPPSCSSPSRAKAASSSRPPAGWPAAPRSASTHNVLLIADEVQTGLGRTGQPAGLRARRRAPGRRDPRQGPGRRPAAGVRLPGRRPPDAGIPAPATTAPPSAATRSPPPWPPRPWPCLPTRSSTSAPPGWAPVFLARLQAIDNPLIREVRGRGLLIGMELDTPRVTARTAAEWLLARGLMTKDTHDRVLRFAPPLIVGTEATSSTSALSDRRSPRPTSPSRFPPESPP